MDFAHSMLTQHPATWKVQGDAMRLPIADRSFDVAFCGNLLHHMPDPVGAVAELARVSRKYVVLVEPSRNNPLMFAFGLLKKEERGTLKMHEGVLRGYLESAGAEVVTSTTMGTVLPNKAPHLLLPALRLIDGRSPLGFYAVAVGRV